MKSDRTLIAALVFLVFASGALSQIERELVNGVNNMIGGDVGVGHLLEGISTGNGYDAKDKSSAEIDAFADTCIEFRFPQLPFPFNQIVFPVIRFYPYTRVRPLKFGSNTRVQSLTFNNNINGQTASVSANAILAVRSGGSFQYRAASGSASAPIKKQYNAQTVRKCTRILFWDDCKNEVVYTERGLYHHEVEAITAKLQREAAIGMKNKISESTGLSFKPALASSAFVEESKKLRALYTEIMYDSSDIQEVPIDQLPNTIQTASLGKINDALILYWVRQKAFFSARSNFFCVPTEDTFFVFEVVNLRSSYTVKFTTFHVKGNRLPVGAFAVSSGNWVFERYGEGSSPSVHQLISIFPPLRA